MIEIGLGRFGDCLSEQTSLPLTSSWASDRRKVDSKWLLDTYFSNLLSPSSAVHCTHRPRSACLLSQKVRAWFPNNLFLRPIRPQKLRPLEFWPFVIFPPWLGREKLQQALSIRAVVNPAHVRATIVIETTITFEHGMPNPKLITPPESHDVPKGPLRNHFRTVFVQVLQLNAIRVFCFVWIIFRPDGRGLGSTT